MDDRHQKLNRKNMMINVAYVLSFGFFSFFRSFFVLFFALLNVCWCDEKHSKSITCTKQSSKIILCFCFGCVNVCKSNHYWSKTRYYWYCWCWIDNNTIIVIIIIRSQNKYKKKNEKDNKNKKQKDKNNQKEKQKQKQKDQTEKAKISDETDAYIYDAASGASVTDDDGDKTDGCKVLKMNY